MSWKSRAGNFVQSMMVEVGLLCLSGWIEGDGYLSELQRSNAWERNGGWRKRAKGNVAVHLLYFSNSIESTMACVVFPN